MNSKFAYKSAFGSQGVMPNDVATRLITLQFTTLSSVWQISTPHPNHGKKEWGFEVTLGCKAMYNNNNNNKGCITLWPCNLH